MPQRHAAEPYQGFEQGPIRPPSEANSLLIRVTRNCPWNRCTFCPVYKRARFSVRPAGHVKQDIDQVAHFITRFTRLQEKAGQLRRAELNAVLQESPPQDLPAFQAALNWYLNGMKAIFIQDANSLIVKPDQLIDILRHLRKNFPRVERITSYARSHTIARIRDDDLNTMARAGLNRIHIGLESGSDRVLARIRKGTTKAGHINAGIKVKRAGIELSEYVMPGLGGKMLSREHALETADALNQIDPDFIRLRTLAIPNHVELSEDFQSGRFEKCTDREIVEEIRLFIESLNGIGSAVKSDHILNLFQEVDGRLPRDKERLLAPLRDFLALAPAEQMLYQVGRRLGIFGELADMDRPHRKAKVQNACRQLGVTPENVDAAIDELMKRFV